MAARNRGSLTGRGGRSRTGPLVAALALAVLTAAATRAQTPTGSAAPPDTTRPVIGLALGGGGARGLAHIGVLARLEELRVPVDRVAGTSIGAVVGALYALGVSPLEIEQLLLAADWRSLLTDRPDRRHLSARRKSDDLVNVWPFEFGITGEGIVMQRGLIAGQKFGLGFAVQDLHTDYRDGFDVLPIPYRALATDLEAGEPVVLDRGNLMTAVRASMAAPGAFPPVEVDGRTLVDGYLRVMLPTDVVRDMGADRVIAVHVGWSPADTPAGRPWSLPDILLQANFILTWHNTVTQLAAADVAMSVALPDIPLYDFTRGVEAVAAGRAAVDRHLEELRPLALPEEEYEAWRRAVRRRPPESPVISAVEIERTARVDPRTVSRRISQPVGAPLDLERLTRDLERVFALGVFESVSFTLVPEPQGSLLAIEPVEKPYLPWVTRFGISLRTSYLDGEQLQLLVRFFRLEINRLGGELRTDLAVGSHLGAACEFYQPLEVSRTLFVAPSLYADSRDVAVFDGSYNIGEYRTETWGGRFDVGVNAGRWGEARAGWRRGRAKSWPRTGVPEVPTLREEVGAAEFVLGLDRLDNLAVPKTGVAGQARLQLGRSGLGDSREYDRYWGHLIGAATAGDLTFHLRAQAGGTKGDTAYDQHFLMGGLRDVTGVAGGSLRGRAFAMGGVGALYRLSGLKLPYAVQSYLGAWVDAGNAWERNADVRLDDLYGGTALSLLLDTALGSLELAYGRSSTGQGTAYLQAGIQFAQPMNP